MSAPAALRHFLKNTNSAEAKQIWDYLDGDPYALNKMISIVVDSHEHKKLFQKLTKVTKEG